MTNIKTNIIVKLQVHGVHRWPDAATICPPMSMLADAHRHTFHITAKKAVNHDDRDIEFIMFKQDIETVLRDAYWCNESRTHQFGNRSCEAIARIIFDYFDCTYVSVFEDDENGAEIYQA